MSDYLSTPCTSFVGARQLASGALIDVALAIKAAEPTTMNAPVLTFDDASGAVVDLDLQGTTADIVNRLTELGELEALAVKTRNRPDIDAPPKGRGRPKLGVIGREVTLLPRHWQWLAAQSGGASQALRRLVDNARRSDDGQTHIKAAREAAYRFLSTLAGDFPGFEEAIRVLFSGDDKAFADRMAAWPADVGNYALKLVGAFQTDGHR